MFVPGQEALKINPSLGLPFSFDLVPLTTVPNKGVVVIAVGVFVCT